MELVKKDSLEASQSQKEEVENLYENLLVSEERTRILDTLLNNNSLDQEGKKQFLDELKEHNVLLSALRCDVTPEDSATLGAFQSEEMESQFPKKSSEMPQSQIATNFKGYWVKKGSLRSGKLVEVSFEYKEPHLNDTIPLFLLLKGENGELVDFIKKCPSLGHSVRPSMVRNNGQKIKFRATIEKKEPESNITDLLVYHAKEGFVGHMKLK